MTTYFEKLRFAIARQQARLWIKKRITRRLGYSPNLNNPKSYCEKIQWLKLNRHAHDAEVIRNADKYRVREYVAEQGYADNLVAFYGVYDTPEEINWEELPERLVFKVNNASGSDHIWFVEDKNQFPIEQFIQQARERLLNKHGVRKGEFHYSKMPAKIIAEEYISEGDDPLKDYSLYCFNGKVLFLSVEIGKFAGKGVIEYYDTKWNKHPVDFYKDDPRAANGFQPPKNLEFMLSMAETLSNDYPHVRVDLYEVNGQVYFGELTYTPEAGFIAWKPVELDFKYGEFIDLDGLKPIL